MKREFDFLVLGSGVAGLSFALKVAKHGSVAVVTKAHLDDSNTVLAQGGIAAVTYGPDNFEKHIQDTIIAGDRYSNKEVVKLVVQEAPERIKELINWGTNFDKTNSGSFDLAKEGGHSENRILHYKDITGREIQRALVEQVKKVENISIFENYFAVDLITQHHLGRKVKRSYRDIECFGAYVLNLKTNDVDTFLAKKIMVATGGSGNLYSTTTNPVIATGDGVAMVYRAKGLVENMEFVQFHPTSLYNPEEKPSFLITEALRGFGGILKTCAGNEFMEKYDARGCLASRDIVARAIDNEMKVNGDDFVYLDCTHLKENDLKEHFPNISAKCLSLGIDIAKEMIPVVPAAHYQCGGVKVDLNGESHIKNLYASGEVASTGLHGANRLASNSLSEAVVFSHRAAMHAISCLNNQTIRYEIPEWNFEGTTHPEEMILITQNYKETQMIMSNYVGIVRSNLRLERALRRLEIIYKETDELYQKSILSEELCELRNLINVGYLIIRSAQNRKESLGLHYIIDYA
ncbi:MAG: L-aspartate oxidase [Salinivirgaceae bacterium]|nr:L-aspartate oxidase [Salinivirgaceae bacterium]